MVRESKQKQVKTQTGADSAEPDAQAGQRGCLEDTLKATDGHYRSRERQKHNNAITKFSSSFFMGALGHSQAVNPSVSGW